VAKRIRITPKNTAKTVNSRGYRTYLYENRVMLLVSFGFSLVGPLQKQEIVLPAECMLLFFLSFMAFSQCFVFLVDTQGVEQAMRTGTLIYLNRMCP
jgi:hypothetical protein